MFLLLASTWAAESAPEVGVGLGHQIGARWELQPGVNLHVDTPLGSRIGVGLAGSAWRLPDVPYFATGHEAANVYLPQAEALLVFRWTPITGDISIAEEGSRPLKVSVVAGAGASWGQARNYRTLYATLIAGRFAPTGTNGAQRQNGVLVPSAALGPRADVGLGHHLFVALQAQLHALNQPRPRAFPEAWAYQLDPRRDPNYRPGLATYGTASIGLSRSL